MRPAAGCCAAVALTALLAACGAPAAVSVAPAPSTASSWMAGAGEALLLAVQQDVADIASATGSYGPDALAIMGPAGSLGADAAQAALLPAPGATGYAAAMQELSAAGYDLASGDMADGTSQLASGEEDLAQALEAGAVTVPAAG